MPAQHRAASPRYRKPMILAGLLVPVLVLAGLYLVHVVGGGKSQASTAADTAQTTRSCASPATAGSTTGVSSAGASTTGASTTSASTTGASTPCPTQPAASPSSAPSSRPVSPGPHHKTPGTRHPHPAPSRPAPSSQPPPPSPSASPQSDAAEQVLALINQARAQAGLPAYTVTAGLDRSSAAHNQLMASGCGLSHQCPGEASLGARETAAGVDWTSAGENIGEGGPEPATASAVTRMAVTLTQDMLNEKPPDDGHRLNILSSAFHHIGITVQEDSSGTVWMTQDFSN